MTRGLRIATNGQWIIFDYSREDLNNMEQYGVERGEGEFHLLEEMIINNKWCNVYGWTHGENFNPFDLDTANPRGDIIVIFLSYHRIPIDIDTIEFFNTYCQSLELDEYLLEDELSEDDSYDYNDPFLVRDDCGDYHHQSNLIIFNII